MNRLTASLVATTVAFASLSTGTVIAVTSASAPTFPCNIMPFLPRCRG